MERKISAELAGYSRFIRCSKQTSVVMTRQVAVGLIVTSPVINPTSPNSAMNSRYFWLLRALMGLVYMTLWLFLRHCAIAYSATTVLPALVCAETSTLSFLCIDAIDTCWKGSKVKGHSRAGFS